MASVTMKFMASFIGLFYQCSHVQGYGGRLPSLYAFLLHDSSPNLVHYDDVNEKPCVAIIWAKSVKRPRSQAIIIDG